MNAMARFARSDAREAVDLAVRMYGHKRGWHVAACALGIKERTARAIACGETTGASIDPDTAFAARMAFRRERAAAIRAELEMLEKETAYGGVDSARVDSGGVGAVRDDRLSVAGLRMVGGVVR